MPRRSNEAETSQTDTTTLVPARCSAAETRRRSASEDEMADQLLAGTATRIADRGSVVASTVCPDHALIDAASGQRVGPSRSTVAGGVAMSWGPVSTAPSADKHKLRKRRSSPSSSPFHGCSTGELDPAKDSRQNTATVGGQDRQDPISLKLAL
ncbi:MAG: hypothetical protein M1815_001310 [Lichina confinis]|nr:MAG: hypothetical protein M1815_001310 [Lichina confinis]